MRDISNMNATANLISAILNFSTGQWAITCVMPKSESLLSFIFHSPIKRNILSVYVYVNVSFNISYLFFSDVFCFYCTSTLRYIYIYIYNLCERWIFFIALIFYTFFLCSIYGLLICTIYDFYIPWTWICTY